MNKEYHKAMKIKGRLLTDEEAAIIMRPLAEMFSRSSAGLKSNRGRKVKPIEGEKPRIPCYDRHYPVFTGPLEGRP